MKRKISLFFLLIYSCSALSQVIPGESLLTYFSANCKSQGEWTRAALADSVALIETLRSISSDESCQSVGGAIAQLGLLSQQLMVLEETNQTQSKIAELNAQEQELLSQITSASDPEILSEVNSTLRNLQIQRAGLIGRQKASDELKAPSKVQSLTQVIQTANATFTQITSNQLCLQKNPAILNTATSLLSAVGATASVVNPALGLGLVAGAEFLGQTVEGIRLHYTNRMIRNLSDSTVALEAYKCALETMSDKFCQIRDARAFLDFKQRYRREGEITPDLGLAIRLNERELPVLIEWLNKIRSGVTPTTTADAQRQNVVFARETFVRSKEASGLGRIEETRPVFDDADKKDHWSIIRTLVYSLLPYEETDFRNPFFEIYAQAYAPFYLLGLRDDESIKNPQTGGYYSLDTWPGKETYVVDFDIVRMNYQNWIDRARLRVNQELAQVLQPDALFTLTSAYERAGNKWKISPMDSLKRIIEFIQKNPPSNDDFAFKKLFQSTINQLTLIYETTQDAIIHQSRTDVNTQSVKDIYDVAKLQYGTVVMKARLDMIIRVSLLELLENSSEEDQILVAQLLAAERFSESISKVKGTDNIELLRFDLLTGQEYTLSNMDNFLEIFSKNIQKSLQKLKSEEEKASGTIARTKRHTRTQLCFLLLGVPKVDQFIKSQLCDGLQIKSKIKEGPKTFVITNSTFKLDISQRACEYKDFFRRSKIFETWGIKQ